LINRFTGVGGAGGDSSAEVKELKAALDKAEADRTKVSNRKAFQSSGVHMDRRMPSVRFFSVLANALVLFSLIVYNLAATFINSGKRALGRCEVRTSLFLEESCLSVTLLKEQYEQ
jgi:hypothetical protein